MFNIEKEKENTPRRNIWKNKEKKKKKSYKENKTS
jgi:hypothetical protein